MGKHRRGARPQQLAGTLLVGCLSAIAIGLGCGDDASGPQADGKSVRAGRKPAPLPALVAADYEEFAFMGPETERMRLFDQLESFMTPDEARAALPLEWEVALERTIPKQGICPGHRTLRLEAPGHTHFGTTGSVELDFENERLMTVLFTPELKDRTPYVKRLQKEGLINGGRYAGPPDPSRPYFRVWVLLAAGSKNVTFEDTRLAKELLAVSDRCRKQVRYEDAGVEIPPAPSS